MPTPTRAAIARLPAYTFGEQGLPGVDRPIQLGQNELGTAPSPAAIAAAAAAVGALNRYPDIAHTRLRAALAEVHGLDPARILCGAGSMELLALLATVYCEPGADVVVSRYGYKFFQVLATVAGATVVVAPEPEMRPDIDALAGAVTAATRLVFVVDPGNPTGSRLAPGELARLRAMLPADVLLVVDGAYAEFAGPDHDPGFALVDAGANLLVTRTFSKAYGLAGLRTGWLYGPAEVAAAITRARTPNSVTVTALAAAEAALRDRAHLAATVAGVVRRREALRAQLLGLGFAAPPSGGNFVLAGCGDGAPLSAADLHDGLRAAGIITRPMGAYGLAGHLRITVGAADEMAALAAALERLCR